MLSRHAGFCQRQLDFLVLSYYDNYFYFQCCTPNGRHSYSCPSPPLATPLAVPTVTRNNSHHSNAKRTLASRQLSSAGCQIRTERERRDWLIEHGFTSPPTQYRLFGRRFLQVKRPNQQYQCRNTQSTQITQKYNKHTDIQKHSKSPSLHWYGVTREGDGGRGR